MKKPKVLIRQGRGMKDTPKSNSHLKSGVAPISSMRNAEKRMGTH